MPSNPERDLFVSMLERAPQEWPAALQAACPDDPALRSRVMALLDAHLACLTADGRRTQETAPQPQARPDPLLGTEIGPYTIRERIGEGGFGLVYVAEQRLPIRRRVALKVLRPGFDSGQVIRRFEAERHTLARMEHPNIARVLDGGELPDGRPWFVMELVRGTPITEYCDTHRLEPSERISLFQDVCAAVQHAHQKGIIHRDIKPSNVLVVHADDRPIVKVIDFGIAKAVAGAATDQTVYTEFRQLVGTPAYMSPEQAHLTGGDVDTRSDVYSLGVLLYELLTGTPPFDPATLARAGLAEMQRVICEVDPPRPSTRLSSLGVQATPVATLRRSEPRRLERLIRGDLDWIVMRAMEKAPARRYDSPAALAADLRRHVRNEAVEAGPPGAGYRALKFIRRNRVWVIAGTVAVSALVAGLALAVTGLLQAASERDHAIQARAEEKTARELAERRREEALRNAERAKVRSDFIAWGLGMGQDAQAAIGSRAAITVRETLDVASATIDRAYAQEPARQALARQELGSLYASLFLPAEARRELERAIGAWRSMPAGRDDAAFAAALSDLIMVEADQGATSLTLARLRQELTMVELELLDRALGDTCPELTASVRALVTLLLEGPPPAPVRLEEMERTVMTQLDRSAPRCSGDDLVLAIDALGTAHAAAQRRWAAPVLASWLVKYVDWLDARTPGRGRADRQVAILHERTAEDAAWGGMDPVALRFARQAREELLHHVPAGHWVDAELLSLEGALLGKLGRPDEAQPRLVEGCRALVDRTGNSQEHVRYGVMRVLAFEHQSGRRGLLAGFPTPLAAHLPPMEDLITAYAPGATTTNAERAAAAQALTDSIRSDAADPGAARREVLMAMLPLLEGFADNTSGAARRPMRELLEALAEGDAGDNAPLRAAQATALWWASVLALGEGAPGNAETLARRALAVAQRDTDPNHFAIANCRRILGRAIVAQGRAQEGREMVRSAWENIQHRTWPTAIARIASARDAAVTLAADDHAAEAGALLAGQAAAMLECEALPGQPPVPPAYHLLIAWPLAQLQGLPAQAYADAERCGRRAVEGLPRLASAHLALAMALLRQGRWSDALPVLAAADAAAAANGARPPAAAALLRSACQRSLGDRGAASESLAEARRRAEGGSTRDSNAVRSWESLLAEFAPAE